MRAAAEVSPGSTRRQGLTWRRKPRRKGQLSGSVPAKGQKRTPVEQTRRRQAARASARSGAGKSAQRQAAGANTGRKTPPQDSPGEGQESRVTPSSGVAAKPRREAGRGRRSRKARRPRARAKAAPGMESQLAQTPETGRIRERPDQPDADEALHRHRLGRGRHPAGPGLERARRHLREVDETVASPPSSLELDRHAVRSAQRPRTKCARPGETTPRSAPTSPPVTSTRTGQDAYSVGDEAPGGDNPTPDQDRVDDIGKALGVEYEDNEELKGSDKIAERDKHRWELDPASSDDYQDRD